MPIVDNRHSNPNKSTDDKSPREEVEKMEIANENNAAQKTTRILPSHTLVSEVSLDSKGQIEHIKIIGRPTKTYTDTMGDHTTAFSIHREGLVLQLHGGDLKTGAEKIRNFHEKCKLLSGYKNIGNLPLFHKERIANAEAQLTTLLKNDYTDVTPINLSHFQELINAYLDFRELIPLSTINVRVKSPALAGKGKGEAGQIQILRDHANGNDIITDLDLEKAIIGLFDSASSALAIAETDPFLKQSMIPGTDPKRKVTEIINDFTSQHKESIAMMFPKASEIVNWTNIEERLVEEIKTRLKSFYTLDYSVHFRLRGCRLAELGRYRQNNPRKPLSKKQRNKTPQKKRKRSRKYLLGKSAITKVIKRHKKVIDDIETSYKLLFDDKLQPLPLPTKTAPIKPATKKRAIKVKKVAPITIEEVAPITIEEVAPITVEESAAVEVEEGTPATETLDRDDEAEQEANMSPLGIQIIMEDDRMVDRIEMAGRTPSPFSGTMGAHSIAWTMHLDYVKASLKGHSLKEAIKKVNTVLVPEAIKEAEKRIKAKFAFDSSDHKKSYDHTLKLLLETTKNTISLSSAAQLAKLRTSINLLLTFINYTPGATLNVVDTGGKAEGQRRSVLRKFEAGGNEYKDYLKMALDGMTDVKLLESSEANLSKEQERLLRSHARQLTRKTYPKSYAAVYGNAYGDQIIAASDPSRKTRKRKRSDDD